MPNLPEIPQRFPEKIMHLASTLPDVKISIPTVEKVLISIQWGEADQVSQLEWIYCIYAKADWDKQNLNRCWETSCAIWQAAIYNPWLQHQLIWRLALYYNGQKEQVLANSLAESFDVFANSDNLKKLSVQIILALRSRNTGKQLARIACEQNCNRSEIINEIRTNIPVWISALSQFIEDIAPHFSSISRPNEQQVNWLLSCLNEMLDEQQIKAVNYLLTNVSQDIASQHSQLVEWLRKNYRGGEKWYKLSEPARKHLRDWIGAINYGDFQKLVGLIIPNLSNQDRPKQLEARQEFWGKYSNRFEKLRILLPQDSLNTLGYQLTGDVDVLKDDGSDSTEVCIFDFGDWIVVEFFRGKGSETRLLPNNSQNQQILFSQSQLSVKCIRCLGGDKHDHVYLWQELCPQWLESKGIIPNEGRHPNKELNPDKLLNREEQLESWRKTIFRLEREAKVYCNRIGC
jgi:hypothetical protein